MSDKATCQRDMIRDQTASKVALLEQDKAVLRDALAEAQRRISYLEDQVEEFRGRLSKVALVELALDILKDPNGGG